MHIDQILQIRNIDLNMVDPGYEKSKSLFIYIIPYYVLTKQSPLKATTIPYF